MKNENKIKGSTKQRRETQNQESMSTGKAIFMVFLTLIGVAVFLFGACFIALGRF